MQLGIKICKQSISQTSGCTCPRAECQFRSGTSGLLGLLCKSTQLLVEQRHLLGRSAFLWSKDIGCTILAKQRIVDIASHNHLTFHVKASTISQSLNHTTSTIAGSTTAYAHYDCLATALHGIGYHLTHTISSGLHWVSSFLRHKRQSACCRHFHIGGLAIRRNCIFNLRPIHERAVHFNGDTHCGQHLSHTFHQAFTTIAQGNLHNHGILPSFTHALSARLACLLCRDTSLERVESQYYLFHSIFSPVPASSPSSSIRGTHICRTSVRVLCHDRIRTPC